ncbi:MAG: endolytic transglycosylase MltG [Ruminococcus sp.]|jgi:UPF0755 protein|nr:endolytic transglycosylase MltG [Ruminococcus sp.]
MSENELEKKRIIDEILQSIPSSNPDEIPEKITDEPEISEASEDETGPDDDIPVQAEDDNGENSAEDLAETADDDTEFIETELVEEEGGDVQPINEEIIEEPEEDPFGSDEFYEEPRRKRKRKSSAMHLVAALLFAAVIVSLSVLGAVMLLGVGREIMGLGRTDSEIVLDIPEDMTTDELADLLLSEGIIENKEYFLYFTRVRSLRTLVSGFHEFRPNMTYGEIADELQATATDNEERIEISVTFPEGIRLSDAAARLENAGVCSADEFISTFNSIDLGYSFEERTTNNIYEFYRMEGYCFPDTYNFYEDENVKSVVQKIFRNTENKLTPDILARADDLGLTQDELMTFASIVQLEVPSRTDMRRVASVFWNRQNDDSFYPKRFESCTTSPYIDEVIKVRADYADPNMLEAYDTYSIIGLPPGPICNPGLEAINAVLYPSETDYFYFCSNLDTKETFFAHTLDEQEENMVLAGLA